jgi:hypothetical protein
MMSLDLVGTVENDVTCPVADWRSCSAIVRMHHARLFITSVAEFPRAMYPSTPGLSGSFGPYNTVTNPAVV